MTRGCTLTSCVFHISNIIRRREEEVVCFAFLVMLVRSAFCVVRSTFCVVRSTFCVLRCAFCVVRSDCAFCVVRYALCDMRCAFCIVRYALCVLRCALCVVSYVLHSGSGLRATLIINDNTALINHTAQIRRHAKTTFPLSYRSWGPALWTYIVRG